jgi:NADPH2:quinone reductase
LALGTGIVKEFKPGERVVALTQFGGYAQYVCVDKNIPIKIPDKMDLDAAVSLVLNYITAFQMIHSTARLKKGNTVLIHSAAGGVGTALLQLGKVMGLKIYGTASVMKHTIVEKYGFAIDYKNEDFVQRIKELEPEGLDAVVFFQLFVIIYRDSVKNEIFLSGYYCEMITN